MCVCCCFCLTVADCVIDMCGRVKDWVFPNCCPGITGGLMALLRDSLKNNDFLLKLRQFKTKLRNYISGRFGSSVVSSP